MALRAFLQWLLFALYIGLCACVPLYVLASWWGVSIGVAFSVLFLVRIRLQGTEKLLKRLHVRPLSRAEAPSVHAAVHEYCRRLAIPAPRIGLMEVRALNVALLGWSRSHTHLILTRGCLTHFSREQLNALIGRELCDAWNGEIPCETWLSQFLATFTAWISAPVTPGATNRRVYSLKLFLKQAILFPLTLFPAFILRGSQDESELDLKAVKLTRRPNAMAEALRKLEAFQERIPLNVSLSDSHLFLLPPRNQDPLARVFFSSEKLTSRVRALESLRRVVAQ